VRIDTATGAETHRVTTGSQPRSMAMAADGTAVYVANYESSTVTKLRADDLSVLDEVGTDHHPIGITYEPTTRTVWVESDIDDTSF
jgi:YVTN family beta-propeller protein